MCAFLSPILVPPDSSRPPNALATDASDFQPDKHLATSTSTNGSLSEISMNIRKVDGTPASQCTNSETRSQPRLCGQSLSIWVGLSSIPLADRYNFGNATFEIQSTRDTLLEGDQRFGGVSENRTKFLA